MLREMAAELPDKFTGLETASQQIGSAVSLIGIVVDFLPASKSQGTDWMCKFSIADGTFGYVGSTGGDGLNVRIFRPSETDMPPIKGIGDILILRHFKIQQWKGMTLAVSSRPSTWACFPASAMPDKLPSSNPSLNYIKEKRAPTPSTNEMKYAFELFNSSGRENFVRSASSLQPSAPKHDVLPNASALPARREKFSLIKDMKVDTFYDVVGQVVKLFPEGGHVDLYLSDYTPNKSLYYYEWGQDDVLQDSRDGDEHGYLTRTQNSKEWPGPFGKLTLPITLWEPHSDYAQEKIKAGNFVFLRNVHIRFDQNSRMVGSLHSDKRNPERIDISLLTNFHNNDRVIGVLQRREEYNKKFHDESERFVNEARELKKTDTESNKQLSKTQAKKKRKQERERELANQENGTAEPSSKRRRSENQDKEISPVSKPLDSSTNPNVNCSNHLVPISPLSTILSTDNHTNTTPNGKTYTLPFHNIKTRATVRVIDFFPSNLADFAVFVDPKSEHDALPRYSDKQLSSAELIQKSKASQSGMYRSQEDDDEEIEQKWRRRWEWRFALLLADASGPKQTASTSGENSKLVAYVCGPDAECLLKLDAEDLRQSPRALAALKERLFLLWGDLEERKAKEGKESTRSDDVDTNEQSSGRALVEIDGNRGSSRSESGNVQERRSEERGRPFQCCLKEYGVKVRNTEVEQDEEHGGHDDESPVAGRAWRWERRWRMFGCTIV